jgi:hypothetical protein
LLVEFGFANNSANNALKILRGYPWFSAMDSLQPSTATQRKRGRKAEHYLDSRGTVINGLARRPSDGRTALGE